MTRKIKEEMYYEKAFYNARRCLKEASDKNHAFQYRVCFLNHPEKNIKEQVMLPDAAVIWCIEHHLPNWSASTWRMYRSSYRYLLQHIKETDSLVDSLISESRLEEIEVVLSSTKAMKKNKKATSGMRMKTLHDTDLNKLVDTCGEKTLKGNARYDCGASLIIWLKSSLATGLRPNEWSTAELLEENGKLMLKCENFKHNEVRSYDTHRTIDLSKLSVDNILAIKQHLMVVSGMLRHGDDHYNGCRNLLSRLNQKLWPNRKKKIGLYTGRHQFSANAKASESTTDVERAALMGHKTTRTSTEGYGKKRSGRNGLTPEISDKAVLQKIKQSQIGSRHKKAVNEESLNTTIRNSPKL
jgi:integrase